MNNMNELLGNIGRTLPVKQAFARHFLRGIDEIVPVTAEMQTWLSRPRETRALICANRMIDDAENILKKYHDTAKGAERGIHAPLPVILIAFAKDRAASDNDQILALPNVQMVQLAECGEYYAMHTDSVVQRVQVAFFAHTAETAHAMTSQMRVYFSRFSHYRFPIAWQFGGYDFELTANISEIPPSDELADLSERSNLTILTWTLTLNYQLPYLNAPKPYTTTQDGKLKGYDTLKRVDFDVKKAENAISSGFVDSTNAQPIHGQWQEK